MKRSKHKPDIAAPLKELANYLGPHYVAQRTRMGHGDVGPLRWSSVSISMPSNSTHFDHIQEIAKSACPPFRVKFLSAKLKEYHSLRGKVYFGGAARQIQQLMVNYPTLRWWVEADGLVIDEIAELGPISDFDRLAGSLTQECWKNGRLSEESLVAIAERLDQERFSLKDHLQPAQWKPIAKYNQKFPKNPIRTFCDAVRQPRFVTSVRRRLYVARERFEKTRRPAQPIEIGVF